MSKFAIIGGGPSAFYTASRLLSNRELSKHSLGGKAPIIHIYDRLWAPHGLVRYGVAPDHPEVKVRELSDTFGPHSHLVCRTARTSSTKSCRTPSSGSLETCRLVEYLARQSRTHFLSVYLTYDNTTRI